MSQSNMSRRSFIAVLTMATAAGVAHCAIADTGSAKFYPAGELEDFKQDTYKKVVLNDGTSVYITKSTADPVGYVALSSKCTHKGCQVLWLPSRNVFRCPCHGGTFDGNGKNVSGPPPSPLKSFKVKVDGSTLMVQP